MPSFQKQNGATLFVSLIILLMMTLFAISSINLSTINLKVVGNMQATKLLDAEAQVALEQVISESSNFLTPTSTTVVTTYGTVTVSTPVCLDSQTATGYSAVNTAIIPDDNTWEIISSVTDDLTGATSTIHTGVKMRMLAGNCP